MSLKKCFDNAPKEIKDEFEKRVKEGMSDRQIRDIGTEILAKHYRDVFEGMENVRQLADPSYKKKEFSSPIKDVSDIDKTYDQRIKDLDSIDEEIEDAKTREEEEEELRKKEESKKEEKKEKRLPGQIYKGKKFTHSGTQWEVVEQVDDGWRIRSGNAVTFVDDGTLKLVISRGNIRREKVADKYLDELRKAFPGASEDAIKKIHNALKDKSLTKAQWDQRVRDILTEDRGLGSAMDIAARYPVSALPENVRGVDSQSMIDKTKSVDAQGVTDMKQAADRSVKQSIEAMAKDGRVSFQDLRSERDQKEFPAGAMGQRLFMEDLSEVSPARVSSGSQLIDIIVAGNQRQRGMAAAYAIANRMVSGENGFVTKLFGRVAKKIRIVYNNQHKVIDPSGAVIAVFESANSAEQYVSSRLDQQYTIQYPNIISAIEADGGTIVINAAKLGERISDFAGENRFFNWAEAALYEELIHFATFKVATDAEIIKIGRELTKEQRKYVEQIYGGVTFVVKKDGRVYKYFRSEYDAEEYIKSRGDEGYEIETVSKLNDYQLGAEYVRMMVQHSITGTTTEMFKPNYTVRSVLAKLVQYLKNILKSSKDSLASKVVARIEEFIKGDQTSIKTVEPLRPKISSVAGTDVYRVTVGERQAFVQKRPGGIYQVVQTKEGVWDPIQDGQFNPGFLGHGHTDAIGKLTEKMSQELGVSIGEQGAYSLQERAPKFGVYPEAATAYSNLSVAKKAKKDGIPKRAIKMATGWEFNDLDQKWRYEILDTDVVKKADRSLLSIEEKNGTYSTRNIHLYELIDDWEVFDAYPSLLFTTIHIFPKNPNLGTTLGWTIPMGSIAIVDTGDKQQMLTTLIHEVQHLIQQKEGFAKGGNPENVLSKISKSNLISAIKKQAGQAYDQEIEILYREMDENAISLMKYNELSSSKKNEIHTRIRVFLSLNKNGSSYEIEEAYKSLEKTFDKYGLRIPMYFSQLKDPYSSETIYDQSRAYVSERIRSLNEEKDEIFSTIAQGTKKEIIKVSQKYLDNVDVHIYTVLAGEVESRNADSRSDVFADYEEMRESLLEETQDVAYEDQIMLMKSDISKELGASQDFAYMSGFYETNRQRQATGQPQLSKAEFLDKLRTNILQQIESYRQTIDRYTQELEQAKRNIAIGEDKAAKLDEASEKTNNVKALELIGENKATNEELYGVDASLDLINRYKGLIRDYQGLMKDAQEMLDQMNASQEDPGKELGASDGPWSSNKDANELFNELMGIPSEADRIWQESRGEYDPVEEFKYQHREYILQDVMMTNVNRSESYEADIAAYERQQIDLAQAEYDMRNLMSEVFMENDVDEAFDYFVIKIMDRDQPMPLKNLILRLLIEKFEGRPDIANLLREKIDTAFSAYSSLTLGSRVDQRTAERGDPASRPGTNRRPPDQYKASWGNDVDSDIINNSIEGAKEALEAKAIVESQMQNNKFSRADYNAAIRRAEEAEERVREILEEIEAAKKYQSRKGVEVDKMVADAKAKESQRRFLSRYEDRKSLVEAIKYLSDKINKIAEKCSG